MLKLKLQYFGHLMRTDDSWCWERSRAEGEEGLRGWNGWMAAPMEWTWTWTNSSRWWEMGSAAVHGVHLCPRVGHKWVAEQQHSITGASQVAREVKNLTANAGDVGDAGLIPGSGRSLGGGHGNPLQYSCLENPHGQRNLVGCKESDTTEAI